MKDIRQFFPNIIQKQSKINSGNGAVANILQFLFINIRKHSQNDRYFKIDILAKSSGKLNIIDLPKLNSMSPNQLKLKN